MSEYKLRKKAIKIITEKTNGIHLFQSCRDLPKFDQEEICDEKVLGVGSFCIVTEVHSIQLRQPNPNSSRAITLNLTQDDLQKRSSIANRCVEEGRGRYALKRVDNSLTRRKDGTFLAGVVDLVMESKYLSAIQHQHIINIFAISSSHPCSDTFFIVLEKMHDTLHERISFWRRNSRLGSHLNHGFHPGGNEDLVKRLEIARDICGVITYLHSNGIIYRDLKPDNLGFDVHDELKLFDFGLAKVLGNDTNQNKYVDTFLLTGVTGSPRYMAPEVALKKPYNLTADIYSLGILIWMIYTLKVPYANYSRDSLHERIYSGRERPDIHSMSKRMRAFFSLSWHQNLYERPRCEKLEIMLKDELLDLSQSSKVNRLALVPERILFGEIVQ